MAHEHTAPRHFADLMAALISALRAQRRRRRDEQDLRALPDHVLRDLAIGRSEIDASLSRGRDIDGRGD